MRWPARWIVVAVLAGAASGLRAQEATWYVNARVAGQPDVRTVVVRDGRVSALGSGAERPPDGAHVVPLDDGWLAPGFTDHHVHLFNVGFWDMNRAERERWFVDLSGARSIADVRAKVAAAARRAPKGAWILGAGWSQGAWGTQALPTAADLAGAADDHPVFLARSDGHAAWSNEQALIRAGYTAHGGNRPIAGGAIVRGLFLERATELVSAQLPPLTDAEVRRAWRRGAELMSERGVVEAFDAGPLAPPGGASLAADFARYVRLLADEDRRQPLPLRVNVMLPAPSAAAESLLARPAPRQLSPSVRITHLKLFTDGALGSRGALLSHPYADDSTTRGVARMTTPEILAWSRRAVDAGLGVASHAIGDEAVHRVLDAYEQLLAERPGLAPGRLRIEHFSYASEGDMARAARLGVVLSIQHVFNAAPDDSLGLGAQRAGAANEGRVYAWDRLSALGARLAEGSDYFAAPLAPMAAYAASLSTRHAVGAGKTDVATRTALLARLWTRWTPEGTPLVGAITVGAPADFVVLDEDPVATPPAQLNARRVLAVVQGGRMVMRTWYDDSLVRPSAQDARPTPPLPFRIGRQGPPMALPVVTGECPVAMLAEPARSALTRRVPLPVAPGTVRMPRQAHVQQFEREDRKYLTAIDDSLNFLATVIEGRELAEARVFWEATTRDVRCTVTRASGESPLVWRVATLAAQSEFGRWVAEGNLPLADGRVLVVAFAAETRARRDALVATLSRDLSARR